MSSALHTPLATPVGSAPAHNATHALSIATLGASLSAFFVLSFVLCVLGYLAFPGLAVSHGLLVLLLPGSVALSWGTFAVGLVECVFWGWYIALVFGSLHNYFSARAYFVRGNARDAR